MNKRHLEQLLNQPQTDYCNADWVTDRPNVLWSTRAFRLLNNDKAASCDGIPAQLLNVLIHYNNMWKLIWEEEMSLKWK